VKRHPHLQPLSDDHHGALVLARRIGSAARASAERGALARAWGDLQSRFALELEPHFRVEEERIFPQLEAAGEAALVERARADHAGLRELARSEPDSAAATRFAELLHRHVRFEERELFPRAESLLPLAALVAAGRAALAARPAPEASARETQRASDFARRLTEEVRNACVEAAIDGYEQAALSGLCGEGALEAAIGAIRMAGLDALAERASRAHSMTGAETPAAAESLRDAALRLTRRFAGPGAPAAGSAAAVTGAIAAGLLEWTAAVSALRGPADFRKRARFIASRGAALQSSLGSAAQTDAELVERWLRTTGAQRRAGTDEPAAGPDGPGAATDSVLDVAARCAQVATLAAEIAAHGHAAVRHDAASALRLGASAAECALALAEENLRSAGETDQARSAKRRAWRTRLVLRRAQALAEAGTPE